MKVPAVSPHSLLRLTKAAQAYSSQSVVHAKQNRLPASYYRGGTSRGVFFNQAHLPSNRAEWPRIFRGVIGSPDPNGRQLDGLGGGISSLSKVCVVKASERDDADVDFTFAALGVKNDQVDFSSNCGNLISAVGSFAIDSGIISTPDSAPDAVVRIYNTNTEKLIHSTFPVIDGEACGYGEIAIDGVAGTAAKVQLDFMHPAGSKTGKLLPTRNVIDIFDGFRATCIDVGNPAVFVSAAEFGVEGSISPDQMENHPTLMSSLSSVRCQAAVKMGIARDIQRVPGSIPKISLVSKSVSNTLSSGVYQDANDIDVLVRAVSVDQPHKAVPITTALAVAVASKMKDSIVHECCSKKPTNPTGLTIGHASGRLVVNAKYDEATGKLVSAGTLRTARRLMEGVVFWK